MQNARLHKVRIKNILSFKESEFSEIGPFGVIIGTNNSGKSNFFRVLMDLELFYSMSQNYLFFGSEPKDAEILLEFKINEECLSKYYKLIKQTYKDFKPKIPPMKFQNVKFQDILSYITLIIRFERTSDNDMIPIINFFGFKNNDFNISLMDTTEGNISPIRVYEFDWRRYSSSISPSFFTQLVKNQFNSTFRKVIERSEGSGHRTFNFFIEIIRDFYKNMTIVLEHRQFISHNQGIPDEKLLGDGSNFPNVLLNNSNNNKEMVEKLQRMLRGFYPDIVKLDQKLVKSNNKSVINYYINDDELNGKTATIPYILEEPIKEKVTFEKLGKGIHQITIILTHLLQTRENGLLLIEEPELFIHPQLQKILFKYFKEFLKDIQILITTHSPFLLDSLESNHSIHHIQKIEGNSIVDAVDKKDLFNVFNKLGIKPSDYLMNNGIILVEGNDDESLIRTLLGDFLEKHHIQLLQFEGKHKLHFWADHEIFSKYIKNKFKFLVLLDKDEGNKKLIDEIKDEDLKSKIQLLPVREIENFYLNPSILTKFLENKYSEYFQKETIKDFIEKSFNLDIQNDLVKEIIIKSFLERQYLHIPWYTRNEIYLKLKIKLNEKENFSLEEIKSIIIGNFTSFVIERFKISNIQINEYNNILEIVLHDLLTNLKRNGWKYLPGKKLLKYLREKLKNDKDIQFQLSELIPYLKINQEVIQFIDTIKTNILSD